MTPGGIRSPEELLIEDDKKMSDIAKKVVKDRYGEMELIKSDEEER
jgi:hypothetical protein